MNKKIPLHFALTCSFLLMSLIFGQHSSAETDQALLYKDKIWQKIGSGKLLNWNGAIKYCEDLAIADFTDWRLPTKQELSELVVCTAPPAKPTSQKLEDIIIGDKPKECKEDLEHGGGGRINPAFKLHMSKDGNGWKSRYWTSTSGFISKSIRLKSDKPDGYFIVPFLYDFLLPKSAASPEELHFVRCIH